MHRTIACAIFLSAANLFAGDAREDWAAVTALDAGPGVVPKTAAEAYADSLAHSDKQEKALRGFLAAHGGDANAFEAMLRLARVLDLRAEMKSEPQSAEALAILEKASSTLLGIWGSSVNGPATLNCWTGWLLNSWITAGA